MPARSGYAPPLPASVAPLAARLENVRAHLLGLEAAVDLTGYGPRRDSARNLLHYLAFRRFDLRRDQARLARWGLSSLGRSESHVLYNLDTVLGWLDRIRGGPPVIRPPTPGPDPERGRRLIERNAAALFGPTRPGRGVRIMVTLPGEAADDYRLVRELLEGGTDCARINCAHDGPAEWTRMIAHVRRAERSLGRRCRIEMDLAGPKIRTGPMRAGPAVLKVRPKRDAFGRVRAAASLWLVPADEIDLVPPGADAVTVPRDWLERRGRREKLELEDARGAHRTLNLVARAGARCRSETCRSIYLTNGLRLRATRSKGGKDAAEIGSVAARPAGIRLVRGDRLVVTARADPGEDAVRDPRGRVQRAAHISCTLPEALRFVRHGESIWFDDGRIGGVVRSARPDELVVEVTHAPTGGTWLAADKGINLPDTALELPPLVPKDLEDLRFIVRHADLVAYSFVRTATDLDRLRHELARLGRPRMGVILKVETRRAFDELPGILLAAAREPRVGVMIARGDLGVEVGYERLAEVQEEILWLCEAAHIPAIWATQVLEGLTKSGLPSRAEVTDAAMGERAECVMLNKGPHVVEAVRALDGILHRMQSHQAKKTAMLRHLNVVESFLADHRSRRPARHAPGSAYPRNLLSTSAGPGPHGRMRPAVPSG